MHQCRCVLFISFAVALGACSSDFVLRDSDGGAPDGGAPDARVPDGGGDAGSPVDSGPECANRDPLNPSDPTRGEWESRFGLPGVGGTAPAVTEIGFGPTGEVYLAGDFALAGNTPARNVAVWTAAAGWRALGDGIDGWVQAMAVGGATVWVAWTGEGDEYDTRLSRWDGTAWTEVTRSENGAIVDLAIVESTLIVAGNFTRIGGVDAMNLARFDGTTWTAWAGFTPDQSLETISARALDDICVAGGFVTLGVVEAVGIACWNGTTWLPRSLPLPNMYMTDLIRDRDGALIVGGNFWLTDGATTGSIARWVTDHWELVGGGVSNSAGGPGHVRGVAAVESGIYAGGYFQWAGGYGTLQVESVARYDGTEWNDIGGLWRDVGWAIGENVWSVASGPDGSVYFGGLFTHAGTTAAAHVVRWDGTYWSALRAPGERTEGIVGHVAAMDRVGACELYVAGGFAYAGDVRANNIARFTHEGGFEALGSGVVGIVSAVDATPDGRQVFIGGNFFDETGAEFANLAVWSGGTWSGVGGGVDGAVSAVVYVPRAGIEDRDLLYVGGSFTHVGDGIAANGLAVWDGETWTAIEGLVGHTPEWATEPDAPVVRAIHVDPATGDVIVGGRFARAGETAAVNIARWDGEAWHAYGDGLGDPQHFVLALASWRDRIVAGGSFKTSGAALADAIVSWTGTAWENVGSGLSSESAPDHYGRGVYTVVAAGALLYAGGIFSVAPNEPAQNVAVFDGTAWRELGDGGLNDLVMALAPMDEGLHVGGGFTQAGNVPSVGLAIWAFDTSSTK